MDIIFVLSQLQKNGVTQAAIAAELCCSQPMVSDMTAGKAGIKRPSFNTVTGLKRLADANGIAYEPEPNPTTQ